VGRDSAVGISTRYGPDGSGIEFQYGGVFPNLSSPALGPMQHHIQCVPGLFPSVNRLGGDDDHPPSSAKVKERVALCLYSSSEPSRPVLG
jgi:hypothetical protein